MPLHAKKHRYNTKKDAKNRFILLLNRNTKLRMFDFFHGELFDDFIFHAMKVKCTEFFRTFSLIMSIVARVVVARVYNKFVSPLFWHCKTPTYVWNEK